MTVPALDVLRETRRGLWAGLIAVKPHLDKPYPDDPRWTPWTRFIERQMAHDKEVTAALADLDALVQAARDVSETERTGVLPDFQPLADALARVTGEAR